MNNIKLTIIVSVSVIFVIILSIFSVQSTQNHAFILEEQVLTAYSDIDIQEKRRIDLLYNLVDCVKEYDKHESETLIAIIEARDAGKNINDATTVISAVAESYPNLKSNENYKSLMTELALTENLIAEYRSNYNKQIKEYNRYIRKFPNRIFLDILGYEKIDYSYLYYNAPDDTPQNLFEDR